MCMPSFPRVVGFLMILSKRIHLMSNPLELVHSDLCCINKPSLAGARYVLSFIDDLCHYTWLYFLTNKSHVFEILKEFRALDENQWGQPVKFLRSDNGGKYVSWYFESTFCSQVLLSRGLSLTLLNRTMLLNERIGLWWRWLDISNRPKTYRRSIGINLFTMPITS